MGYVLDSRRSTRPTLRSLAARAHSWRSFRGSKAFACRLDCAWATASRGFLAEHDLRRHFLGMYTQISSLKSSKPDYGTLGRSEPER